MLSRNHIYTFQNAGSGKMLALSDTAVNGQNVIQYDANSSNKQRWKYSGSKLLTMHNTNFSLDRYRGTNNADVWTASSSEDNDQKVFIQVNSNTHTCRIVLLSTLDTANQLYLTAYGSGNGSGDGKATGSDGNVFWAAPTDSNYQTWYYTDEGSSSEPTVDISAGALIQLKSVAHSTKSLNVYGTTSIKEGQNICLYNSSDTDPMQNWLVQSAGNGNFILHSTLNELYTLACSDGTKSSPSSNADARAVSNSSVKKEVTFERIYGDTFYIKLAGSNQYLTAAASATASPGTVSSLTANGNVYWAARTTANRGYQQWTVKIICAAPTSTNNVQLRGLDTHSLGDDADGIDATLAAIRESGDDIRFIGRYYCRDKDGTSKKLLRRNEAEKIHAAGFKIFSIYQDANNNASCFAINEAEKDANAAYNKAHDAGQKDGTPIYFAVDFDPTATEIRDVIVPYFRRIKEIFETTYSNRYTVGVYGSGAVCQKIKQEQRIATHSWLAQSTGYTGTAAYNRPDLYDLKQGMNYPNYNNNFDDVLSGNNPDFGQW